MEHIAKVAAVALADLVAWRATRGIGARWARRSGWLLLACAACWVLVG